MKLAWELNRKFFARAFFALKKCSLREFYDTPTSLGTQASEKCRLQNLVDFKQKHWNYPLQESRFFDASQVFFLKLPIESVCGKRPLRQFSGLQRDQGQRNSPQKMKSGWELGPVHMEVGDPGKVRYPIYPRSEKTGLHMQPRGAGVRFKKAIAWSLSTYINKDGDGRHFSFRCSTGTTSPLSKTGWSAWLSDSTNAPSTPSDLSSMALWSMFWRWYLRKSSPCLYWIQRQLPGWTSPHPASSIHMEKTHLS